MTQNTVKGSTYITSIEVTNVNTLAEVTPNTGTFNIVGNVNSTQVINCQKLTTTLQTGDCITTFGNRFSVAADTGDVHSSGVINGQRMNASLVTTTGNTGNAYSSSGNKFIVNAATGSITTTGSTTTAGITSTSGDVTIRNSSGQDKVTINTTTGVSTFIGNLITSSTGAGTGDLTVGGNASITGDASVTGNTSIVGNTTSSKFISNATSDNAIATNQNKMRVVASTGRIITFGGITSTGSVTCQDVFSVTNSQNVDIFKVDESNGNIIINGTISISQNAFSILTSATGPISIGLNNVSISTDDIVIGRSNTLAGNAGIAIGKSNKAIGTTCSVAIGKTCDAEGQESVAIGSGCEASGIASVAIGKGATASGGGSFALGENATSTHARSFALGLNAATTNNDQLMLHVAYLTLKNANSNAVILQLVNTHGYQQIWTYYHYLYYDNYNVNGGHIFRHMSGTTVTTALRIERTGRIMMGNGSALNQLAEVIIRKSGAQLMIEHTSNGDAMIRFSSGPSYQNRFHEIRCQFYAAGFNGPLNKMHFKVNVGNQNNPSDTMTLTGNGNLSITGGFSQSSDDRLKTNEELIVDGLSTIMKLRPQIYHKHFYKTVYDENDEYVNYEVLNDYNVESGLIAQEIYYDAPELRHLITLGGDPDIEQHIDTSKDPKVDPDYSSWGKHIASVNYNGILPYIIKAVQQQNDVINQQNVKIAHLEEQLKMLINIMQEIDHDDK